MSAAGTFAAETVETFFGVHREGFSTALFVVMERTPVQTGFGSANVEADCRKQSEQQLGVRWVAPTFTVGLVKGERS